MLWKSARPQYVPVNQPRKGRTSKMTSEFFSLKREKAHTYSDVGRNMAFPEKNSLSFKLEVGVVFSGWICEFVFLTQT